MALATLAASFLRGESVSDDPTPSAQSAVTPSVASETGSASHLTDGPVAVGRAFATPPPAPTVDPPVRVVVAGARIDAVVVPVGVAADGQMELPADPDVVGWYRYGSTPREDSGSVVLGGHVDSRRYGIGQLARLRGAEVSDEVVVHTAGGSAVPYRVVRVQSLPKAALPVEELFRRVGNEQVVLVTCGGTFDRSRGGYEENIIVTAVPA
ncbi:MAG: class F sortase [Jiangellaceae bacterium]